MTEPVQQNTNSMVVDKPQPTNNNSGIKIILVLILVLCLCILAGIIVVVISAGLYVNTAVNELDRVFKEETGQSLNDVVKEIEKLDANSKNSSNSKNNNSSNEDKDEDVDFYDFFGSLFGNAKLPENLPSFLPIYNKNSKVVSVNENENSASKQTDITLSIKAPSGKEIFENIRSDLRSNGWTIENTSTAGETYSISGSIEQNYALNITIMPKLFSDKKDEWTLRYVLTEYFN